ncbi:hypothetical protein AB0392_50580 [Nonomuraea angiospora]|uniref:hypothetical protein n=1 Tax=Nonomuraea angiospora TaxID=46172 RepID=UPI00344DF112
MTATHHQHPDHIRIAQVGQAVGRLLDAIAASADYQRDGIVTYQSAPNGRWQAGTHTCGTGTINTARSGGFVTIQVTGRTTQGLALTQAGLRLARARQARRLVKVLEGEVTTLAAITAHPRQDQCKTVTVEATVIALEEKESDKTGKLWAILTLEDAGATGDAWIHSRGYERLKGTFTAGDRVRVTAPLQWKPSGRLVLHVQGFRKVDA